MRLKRLLTAAVGLVAPTRLKPPLLRALGHSVAPGVKIGISILLTDRLAMAPGSHIGHGNFIDCRRLIINKDGAVHHGNMLRGPISIRIGERSAIGNRNTVVRPPAPLSYGPAHLYLGDFSKVTSQHRLDLTRSVRLGEYTTIAGIASQLWTHGYYHESIGIGRFRVDGQIEIGNNVYVGSACVISMGVAIADAITVGSHATVTKNLVEPGLYVNQPLRELPVDLDKVRARLRRLPEGVGGEIVYTKS